MGVKGALLFAFFSSQPIESTTVMDAPAKIPLAAVVRSEGLASTSSAMIDVKFGATAGLHGITALGFRNRFCTRVQAIEVQKLGLWHSGFHAAGLELIPDEDHEHRAFDLCVLLPKNANLWVGATALRITVEFHERWRSAVPSLTAISVYQTPTDAKTVYSTLATETTLAHGRDTARLETLRRPPVSIVGPASVRHSGALSAVSSALNTSEGPGPTMLGTVDNAFLRDLSSYFSYPAQGETLHVEAVGLLPMTKN